MSIAFKADLTNLSDNSMQLLLRIMPCIHDILVIFTQMEPNLAFLHGELHQVEQVCQQQPTCMPIAFKADLYITNIKVIQEIVRIIPCIHDVLVIFGQLELNLAFQHDEQHQASV